MLDDRLEYRWCASHSERESIQAVELFVRRVYQIFSLLLAHLELKVCIGKVKHREPVSSSELLEDLIARRHRVLLHVQMRVHADFEVPADPDATVGFRYGVVLNSATSIKFSTFAFTSRNKFLLHERSIRVGHRARLVDLERRALLEVQVPGIPLDASR